MIDTEKVCSERINSSGVWWQISRNHKDTMAKGCRDAARKRDRLGSGENGGIPLWAELKSLIGVATDRTEDKRIFFAAHSRANTSFDNDLIIKALGLKVNFTHIQTIFSSDSDTESNEVADTKLSKQNCYGKVNPFNIDQIFEELLGKDISSELLYHIFDISLNLNGGSPDTIMSNLGNRKIAFEMHPKDLIKVVKTLSPKVIISHISNPCSIWLGLKGEPKRDYWVQFPPPAGPKIGIITGNGPESGITLWGDIIKTLRSKFYKLPDVLMPDIYVHSFPQMGLSMELIKREESVWGAMEKALIELLNVGCKIITLACNTTIYFEPRIIELCKKYDAKFVSIAEACMPIIKYELSRSDSGNRVGLLGIGPVINFNDSYSGYKKHFEAAGIKVSPCNGDELAFRFKSMGHKRTLVTDFKKLINEQLPNEKVVVLALTEISMVYREYQKLNRNKKETDQIFIDPLIELSHFISYLYLVHGYRNNPVCQIPSDFPIEDKLFDWIIFNKPKKDIFKS